MAKTDTKKTEAKKPTALTKYDIPSESSMAETRAQAGGGGRLSLKKDHEYILRLVPGANGQKPTIGFKSAFVKIDDKTMFAVNKIGPQNTYLDDLLRLYEKSADPMERARADYNDFKNTWVFKKKFFALVVDRENMAAGVQILQMGKKLWDQIEELTSDKKVKLYGNPFDPINGRDLIIKVGDDYSYSVLPSPDRSKLLDDPEEMDALIESQPSLLDEVNRDVYDYAALKAKFAEAMGYESEDEDPVAQAQNAAPPERQLRSSRWGQSVQQGMRGKEHEVIDVEVEGEGDEPLV